MGICYIRGCLSASTARGSTARSARTSLFVRSADMDSWKPEHLIAMKLGGNAKALKFFKGHGWGAEDTDCVAKYNSRAAKMYHKALYRQVKDELVMGGADQIKVLSPEITSRKRLRPPLETWAWKT